MLPDRPSSQVPPPRPADQAPPLDAGRDARPPPPAAPSHRVQFLALIGAIGLAFAVYAFTMSVTAGRKLALQRDGAVLSDLMDSWHRLLQVTNQLPYREDRPEAAWKEGVHLFDEFQAKLDAFEQGGMDRERLLDPARRRDVASLAQGLRYGNQFIQETYDDLGQFIAHNRERGHESILGSTLYDILRNIGGYSYEDNDLLHFSRMFQDVRRLGFSFTDQLEARQERIQDAIEEEIARLTRLYSAIQAGLLLLVGLAMTLLLLRLLALFRSLQEREALHRTVLSAMAEGVCLVDGRGRIATVNPAAERFAGRPARELVGTPVVGAGPRPIREDGTPFPPGRMPVEAALRTGEPQAEVVMGLPRADRTLLWTSVSVQPLASGGDRRPHGVVVTVRDITERRRAGEQLRRTEEQLRQAQKMEAIGNLAGGIAHDFNNLLSVILGGCAILAEELPERDPRRSSLEEIRTAGERAADLTRQLLAFSRKQILPPRVVDLNDVVRRMERMLKRLIGEDVALTVTAAPDLHLVKVDPGQLEQVIMNLVVNSRDAMPHGGTLTIETANVLVDDRLAADHAGVLPGPHVMLAIHDTGVGMSGETQQRMFEPFFTTKARGKGTGLGLATVLGIVQQSGGTIQAQSEPGKGTTFRIYLPGTTERPPEGERAHPAGARTQGTETILVVEDEDQVRSLLGTILERAGYRVVAASDAPDALRAWERSAAPFHLLVTDVVMPGMSGRALADELRKQRSDLKVLYISGYTDQAIVHHGVLDPGTHFLPKPIVPEALTRKVRQVLDE